MTVQVAEAVSNFSHSLHNIEQLVTRLQSQPWSQICAADTPPLDSARLHLMIAYTVNSLFWMYLRTQGMDAHSHPVRAELERVKKALRKVKEAEQSAAAARADHRKGNPGLFFVCTYECFSGELDKETHLRRASGALSS